MGQATVQAGGQFVETIEEIQALPVGSLIKDGRGRMQFRTAANGWVSVAATHTASMYIALPARVLYFAS